MIAKNVEFDYSKLKGTIVERYGSQKNFAEALGISTAQLSANLSNKKRISVKTMDRIIDLMNIGKDDIGQYFFTVKVL